MTRPQDPRKRGRLRALRGSLIAIFAAPTVLIVAACRLGLTVDVQDAGANAPLNDLRDAAAVSVTSGADSGRAPDALVASLCPSGVCDPGNPASCASDAEVRSCTLTAAGPACATAGALAEGNACKVSVDCAPGTDCIAAGQCRQYCCDGNCHSDKKFCDIQAKNDARGVVIPVCVPVRPCKLLASQASCLENETCAIVGSAGATSCVEIGKATKDQLCEQDHCVAGNVCLGVLGSRKCYQLCSAATPCPSGEECRSSKPLFLDPSVGICQPK
jgi:hypothetical protein